MHYQGHQTLVVKYIVVQVSPQKVAKLIFWVTDGHPWQGTKVYILAVVCVGQLNKIMSSAIVTPRPWHEGCQTYAAFPLFPPAWPVPLLSTATGRGLNSHSTSKPGWQWSSGRGRTGSLPCSPCSIHPKTTAASPSSNHRGGNPLRWPEGFPLWQSHPQIHSLTPMWSEGLSARAYWNYEAKAFWGHSMVSFTPQHSSLN